MLKNNILKVDSQLNSNFQELLKEIDINVDVDDNLSKSQKCAFELFKNGENLLILGVGGSGKSFLLKTMEEYIKTNCRNKNMYVCSTTGISAYNIGGMTIHSFMGIGTGEMPVDVLIKRIKRRKVYKERIMRCDILVIDEVSMLSAELFEKLNIICREIRRDKRFFGGIQVVLTGDFLQLLPVFNKNKELYDQVDERLIIESDLFNKMFNKKNIITLKENFRQKNDKKFIDLLLRIRDGSYTKEDIKLLKTRKISDINKCELDNIVNLVAGNKKAQVINDVQLNKLDTPKVKYVSSYISSGMNKDVQDLLMNELKFQFGQRGINELTLKKGARVMLIKNLDVSVGLVNGAIGTIVDFIPDPSQDVNYSIPVVEFDSTGIKYPISVATWELEIDGCKGMACQVPLMLAYAITIHKSQSLTLESAVLDLSDCFCEHQVYTALSRLKSLNGVYLKSFNEKRIKVNNKMREFLDKLE